jgi:hypothetical protein
MSEAKLYNVGYISSQNISGSHLTVFLQSGNEYTDNYNWFNASSAQLGNWLASGEKLSKWFYISAGAYADAYASGEKWYKAYQSGASIRELAIQPANITTPLSGQTLTYQQNLGQWKNTYPSITFSVANVFISANSNLNLARFETGSGKNCYLWQAQCAGSGGATISGLCVEYSGASTVRYKTSSSVIQQGNPLAVSTGPVEIRMMYSGGNLLTGGQYGTAFVNVSIY